mgnify:CR=1 FL=1
MASVCNHPGCPKLKPCPTHPPKAWHGSNRSSELPSDWKQRKQQRHVIDNWTCVDCGLRDPSGRTLECDHLVRDDHRVEMLRTRCCDVAKGGNGCHRQQTSAQATEARKAKWQKRR